MRIDTASRTVRLAFFVLALIVSVGVFFAYYRGSISARKQSIQNTATASLAFAADDLGARLENWKTVVGNAPHHEKFQRYIELLVPGLSPERDCGANVPKIELGSPALLSLKSSGSFAFEFSDGPLHCASVQTETLEGIFSGLTDKFEDVLIADEDGTVYYRLAHTGPKITQIDLLVEASKEGSEESASGAGFFSKLLPGGEPSSHTSSGAGDELTKVLKHISPSHRSHDFTSFSSLLSVKLGGEPFVMVVQPVPLVTASVKKGDDKHLILAGLIRSATIEKESKAWPESTAAWVMLGLVIAYGIVYSLSCIPMKPRLQPVRALDVVKVAFCALVCCSAIALAMTHGYFIAVSGHDESLVRLADEMEKHLRQELCGFYQVLDGMYLSQELRQSALDRAAPPNAKGGKQTESKCRVITNLLAEESCNLEPTQIRASAIAYSDPFFDFVVWSSWQGDAKDGQIAKWSIRQMETPPTKMTQFNWFKEARDKRLYRLHAVSAEERRLLQNSDSQSIFVEPLRSPNTGEYLTVIVRHFNWLPNSKGTPEDLERGIVGTLVAPLASLNSPVFPPGYGFAVIRQDGLVLFSSDQKRNQRENLFRQTGTNEALMGAVRTGSARTMRLKMGGQELLAHVLPLDSTLEGARWNIVVYRDLARDSQVQLDTLIQTMKFLIPHGLVMLTLTFGLWFLLSKQNVSHLFPSSQKGPEYATLFFLLVLITVFTWILTLVSGRTEVFAEALLLPPVAVGMVYAFMRQRYRILFILACLYPVIAIVNAGIAAADTGPAHGERGIWNLFLIGIGFLICGLAFFAKLRIEGISALLCRLPRRSDLVLYTCVACNGIFLLSVLPTIGYYRVAFQMVGATAAIEDLVAITNSLEARARSAENYYAEIHLPHQTSEPKEPKEPDMAEIERKRFIEDRLNLTLDRYDTLISGTWATVETTHNRAIPFIDRIAASISSASFAPLRTPALIATVPDSGRGPDSPSRLFHVEKWPLQQFDYKSEFLKGKVRDDFPSKLSQWGYHRQAGLVPDFNPASRALWIFALVLSVLVGAGVYFTVRSLFFTHFRVPSVWPDIRIVDLPGADHIILLRMVGAPAYKAAELLLPSGEPSMDYADLRKIQKLDDLPPWQDSSRPVLLDNFDFSFDSEAVAEVHLTVLENLLFSDRRRLILVAAVDPVEYLAEIPDPDKTGGPVRAKWFHDNEERWNRVFLFFGRRPLALETPDADKDPETALRFARCIYASCTDAQKAVLYQIAEYGLVNPNNERALSALVSRGWVTLRPMPALADALAFMRPHLPALTGTERIARWNTADASSSAWITGVTLLAVFLFTALVLAGPDLTQNLPGTLTGLLAGILPLWRGIAALQNRAANSAPKDDNVA